MPPFFCFLERRVGLRPTRRKIQGVVCPYSHEAPPPATFLFSALSLSSLKWIETKVYAPEMPWPAAGGPDQAGVRAIAHPVRPQHHRTRPGDPPLQGYLTPQEPTPPRTLRSLDGFAAVHTNRIGSCMRPQRHRASSSCPQRYQARPGAPPYRGTSLIRNHLPVGPYSRPMRRALLLSKGGGPSL